MIETLQIIIYEYILGFCLQGFTLVFGIYTFNQQKIVLKDYLSASTLVTIITYIVRLLPISFGVHTIIHILASIFICITLLKMPAFTTIRSMSIVIVLLLGSEMIDIAFFMMIMGRERYENAMHYPLQKAITAIPANVLFLLLVTLSYYLLKKKGDSNRKVSS